MFRTLRLLIVLGLLTSPIWIAALALESAPAVEEGASLSVDDVANARRLLKDNDPRKLRDGERKQFELTQREVNLVLNYALSGGRAALATLEPGRMVILASTSVPENPLGDFLNVKLEVFEQGAALRPGALTVGRINLPAWVVAGVTNIGNAILTRVIPEYQALLDSLEAVRMDTDSLAVSYQWRRDVIEKLKDRGRDFMLPAEQRRLILAYYARIDEVTSTLPRRTSLATVMGPLFEEAATRTRGGADPADENRALLLALGMALQGTHPDRLAGPEVAPVRRIRWMYMTLHGRADLARHFGISAALAAGGGSELADIIGVFKELSDSQGGSGFSFPDLLADRAGVVLADYAIGGDALQMQQLLAGQQDETLFMPHIDRLPEGLQDLEFRTRYEDLDSATYEKVRLEVERRIDGLALYRRLASR